MSISSVSIQMIKFQKVISFENSFVIISQYLTLDRFSL